MLPRILNVIFGAFFVAIATIFAAAGISNLYQDERFTGDVVRTSGTVDRLSESYQSKGGTIHEVSYHYSEGNVVFHVVKLAVTNGTWQRLHAGDRVPVKYLRGQTDESRLDLATEDHMHWQDGEVLAPVGLLFIGIGLYIALRMPPPSSSRGIPLSEVISRMQSGWRNR